MVINVLFLTILVTFAKASHAVKFEPYIKYGTIDADEKDHKKATGHKSMIGTGFNLIFGAEERFKKILGAEYWTMAEPVDEDHEVPHDGIVLSGKFSYDFFPYADTVIYPFAGLGLERWRRNSPEEAQKRFYGDLYFANTTFGFGAKHKNIYFEAGGLLPFWSDTDSGQEPNGKLGFTLNTGILYKNIDFGLFYSQKKFGGDGSQTDFQLEQYGFIIRYKF